jgi:glyoxylase-like metal-dependent hydrolase (beta-lactamase superfamily II)
MKLHVLDLGTVMADQGWSIMGAGAATQSNPSPQSVRRQLKIIGTLIEHPKAGVILYECGAAPTYRELWPAPVQDAFAVAGYTEEHRLDKRLNKAGYEIKDVKAIIMGHLHLDHAGGLEFFRGHNVPIYVHEQELKYAFYAVCTKEDFGAYLPHYLDPSFNWKALHGSEIELFDGLTLHHTPGHTPGLMALEVKLKNSEPFLLTSDQFHVKENYFEERPLGWLIRDMSAWWTSLRKIQRLAGRANANLLFGHDPDMLAKYTKEQYYD